MKKLFLVCLAVALIFACSKVQDVSAIRIVGSNTEYQGINQTSDAQTILLKKKTFSILKNANFGTLAFSQYALADSAEIENVIGSSDSVIVLNAKGLGIYFPGKKEFVQFKNYGFSTCDKMAKSNSNIIVATGATAFNLGKPSILSLYKVSDKSELQYVDQVVAPIYVSIATFKNHIYGLSSLGNIDVYEISSDNTLKKIKEITNLNATKMTVFPALSKIVTITPAGIIQYSIGSDYGLTELNKIMKGTL